MKSAIHDQQEVQAIRNMVTDSVKKAVKKEFDSHLSSTKSGYPDLSRQLSRLHTQLSTLLVMMSH